MSDSSNDSVGSEICESYPGPPFKKQRQPWPGLNDSMKPLPDCGEHTYVGHGRLRNMTALITGGDSGIGRAVAIAFAREGADIVINHLDAETSDADVTLHYIRQSGRSGHSIAGDITSEKFCERLVRQAAKKLGGVIDVFVNCAGKQNACRDFADITTSDFDVTFKTNVYALFWLTKYVMDYMKPGSSIITTASGQAFNPFPSLVDYAASKGAVVTFTKALARQLTPRGIRVNSVSPGPFWTPLEVSGGMMDNDLVRYGSDTPIGRPGQPVEISHLYVTLASPLSTFASGGVWGCDGGKGESV